jgi:hypothetical protein
METVVAHLLLHALTRKPAYLFPSSGASHSIRQKSAWALSGESRGAHARVRGMARLGFFYNLPMDAVTNDHISSTAFRSGSRLKTGRPTRRGFWGGFANRLSAAHGGRSQGVKRCRRASCPAPSAETRRGQSWDNQRKRDCAALEASSSRRLAYLAETELLKQLCNLLREPSLRAAQQANALWHFVPRLALAIRG